MGWSTRYGRAMLAEKRGQNEALGLLVLRCAVGQRVSPMRNLLSTKGPIGPGQARRGPGARAGTRGRARPGPGLARPGQARGGPEAKKWPRRHPVASPWGPMGPCGALGALCGPYGALLGPLC